MSEPCEHDWTAYSSLLRFTDAQVRELRSDEAASGLAVSGQLVGCAGCGEVRVMRSVGHRVRVSAAGQGTVAPPTPGTWLDAGRPLY